MRFSKLSLVAKLVCTGIVHPPPMGVTTASPFATEHLFYFSKLTTDLHSHLEIGSATVSCTNACNVVVIRSVSLL